MKQLAATRLSMERSMSSGAGLLAASFSGTEGPATGDPPALRECPGFLRWGIGGVQPLEVVCAWRSEFERFRFFPTKRR